MIASRRSNVRRLAGAAACLLAWLVATPPGGGLRAADEDIEIACDVQYRTVDGVYVNVGTRDGVRSGQFAQLLRDGESVARVEALHVRSGSALLRVVSREPAVDLEPGPRYSLVFRAASPAAEEDDARSPTLRDREAEPKPFVPLLAPPELESEAVTESSNLFHGNLTLGQVVGLSTENDRDFWITRLRSSGTLERIEATPWTLEWAGDLSYRDGALMEDIRDFREPRLEVYRLSFFRRFENRSLLRVGRFIPRALPSVGYVDGLQAENAQSENLRLGAVLGFKPERDSLSPSIDEILAVPYITCGLGEEEALRYTATVGVLASLYEGSSDRLAILAEQQLRLEDLTVSSSSEFDFDVGGAETYDVAQFTRWNVVATYFWSDLFIPSAGLDRFSLPDTEAERDSLRSGTIDPAEFIEDDYWRVWVAAEHQLPWSLRLREEISYMESDIDDAFRGTISLTRIGLPWFPRGQLTLSVYNLAGLESDGAGARLSGYLPVLDGTLALQPSVSVRYTEFETRGANFFDEVDEDFAVADVSLRAHWYLGRTWTVMAGASYLAREADDEFVFDVSLSYRW